MGANAEGCLLMRTAPAFPEPSRRQFAKSRRLVRKCLSGMFIYQVTWRSNLSLRYILGVRT